MAVEDKYVDADTEADKAGSALFVSGTDGTVAQATVAIAAADSDLSVFRVFKDVPASLVPVKITIHNTALTGGTDWDVGLYRADRGIVVDKDVLADGISMATARVIAVDNNTGMTTIVLADGGKDLGELSAQTDIDPSYDIALTANVIGTVAGTIRVTAWFASK